MSHTTRLHAEAENEAIPERLREFRSFVHKAAAGAIQSCASSHDWPNAVVVVLEQRDRRRARFDAYVITRKAALSLLEGEGITGAAEKIRAVPDRVPVLGWRDEAGGSELVLVWCEIFVCSAPGTPARGRPS